MTRIERMMGLSFRFSEIPCHLVHDTPSRRLRLFSCHSCVSWLFILTGGRVMNLGEFLKRAPSHCLSISSTNCRVFSRLLYLWNSLQMTQRLYPKRLTNSINPESSPNLDYSQRCSTAHFSCDSCLSWLYLHA